MDKLNTTKGLEIQITTRDVLNGKFKESISAIYSFLESAKRAKIKGRQFNTVTVVDNMEDISDKFEQELKQLEESIKLK